jgi:hypothetical protein
MKNKTIRAPKADNIVIRRSTISKQLGHVTGVK